MHKLIRTLCLVACLLSTSVLSYGQTSAELPHHLLGVQMGAAFYTGDMLGVANAPSDLRNGFSWAANYTYLFGQNKRVRFGLGGLYQGSRYAHEESLARDQITTHFLAPQLSVCFSSAPFLWGVSAGVGYQLYANHGSIYDRPRRLSMNKVAGNIRLEGTWLFSQRWGLSARLNYIHAFSDSYTVRYHGESWEVRPGYNLDDAVWYDISQLSLSLGLHYQL